jgi:uncharacterized coiled-coil protein SlyX
VSTETENKLARAARSAQRLAELSDVPRDDSTPDLFPNDSTRATLQAMTIDVRQGTLTGFELPEVVSAAAEAAEGDGEVAVLPDAKAARRTTRAATADDMARVDIGHADSPAMPAAPDVLQDVTVVAERGGLDVEQRKTTDAGALHVDNAEAAVDAQDGTAVAPPMAASVQRNMAATRRPAAETDEAAAVKPGMPPTAPYNVPPSAPNAPHATPELEHARAAAFADTIDALYGVIADQRRAATDHSRRMKWMLSVVVCALLVTVAIGIAQTLLLMRLTRNTTVQQQRIEQMMLNQQATLATLLDTDSSTAATPAVAPPPPPAAPAAAVTTTAARPADTHAAKTQHTARKHKPAHPH